MSDYAKILSLSYDNAIAEKTFALKSYYRSVRLIKTSNIPSPDQPSYITNILLCGNCVDPETRCLYVFYIDTLERIRSSTGEPYNSSWIIEINIDTRVQTVVYYDKYNAIGFDPKHKIHNAKVVHGRIIWTDDLNPIYQMDVKRAKRSFYYGIGYGQYPITEEWSSVKTGGYGEGQIVSYGNSFYKSLIFGNDNINPSGDDGTNWTKLCTIEDAYYSMDVKNFYFEPIPPKHPPVVTYKSDGTRKVNNLRQTLFQIAYRYVYMDWRKSTFSPASIVPVPQAEEDAATGLANEQISLNNQLQIVVNSGGEEVRAIEIIGRSSQDVSKWFLIDTIEKFTTQEKGTELSASVGLPYVSLGVSIPQPIILNGSIKDADATGVASLTLPVPTVLISYITSSEMDLSWYAIDVGVYLAKGTVIDCAPGYGYLMAKPDWLTIESPIGTIIAVGDYVSSGSTLLIYPQDVNLGGAVSGVVIMANAYGDSVSIAVSRKAAVVLPPATLINANVIISPSEPNELVIESVINASGLTGNVSITLAVNFVTDPIRSDPFVMYWKATTNGVLSGRGNVVVYSDSFSGIITLNTALQTGDVVNIYLSLIYI